MRVIAGRLRRRVLKAPTWKGLRPTADRLKETLFNILAPAMAGARVLDGFAGSGALGIEAISRGAASVLFVDEDARSIALVADNLAHCGVSDGYMMIRGDFAGTLRRLPPSQRFDVILLDPPYGECDADGFLAPASERLAEDGVLVLEYSKKRQIPDEAAGLRCVRRVVSGASALAFFRTVRAPREAEGDAATRLPPKSVEAS